MLSLHIGFSVVRAAVACSIPERISGFEASSKTNAPRCLKIVMVPSFCPFLLMFLLVPLALFVISLVFSLLISILYLVQVLSRLQLGFLVQATQKAPLGRDAKNVCLQYFTLNKFCMKIFWRQGTHQRNKNSRLVLLSRFMCSNVMVQHCPRP